MSTECRAQYVPADGVAPGARIVECGLPAGHYPQTNHEETDTGVRWYTLPDPPGTSAHPSDQGESVRDRPAAEPPDLDAIRQRYETYHHHKHHEGELDAYVDAAAYCGDDVPALLAELARLALDYAQARDEATALRAERDLDRWTSIRLQQTIDAYLKTDEAGVHAAANLAHARAERDELREKLARSRAANQSITEQHKTAVNGMAELASQLHQAQRERDLAIAHDRQPYPTADAYERACLALEVHRDRAHRLAATVERVRAIHSPRQVPTAPDGYMVCDTCDQGPPPKRHVRWPCKTASALDAPPVDACAAPAIDAAHLEWQREWSRRTFGPGRRTGGVLDHIRKELAEIEADPTDLHEWVDVIILAFDGAWRAGWEPQETIDAVKAKQTRNEARTWPDWRGASEDVAIEHDRSVDAGTSEASSGRIVELSQVSAYVWEDPASGEQRWLSPADVTLVMVGDRNANGDVAGVMVPPTPRTWALPEDRDAAKAAIHPALHDLNVRIVGLDKGDCHCNLIAEVVLDALTHATGEMPTATVDLAKADVANEVLDA
jgi:hypothetical protein